MRMFNQYGSCLLLFLAVAVGCSPGSVEPDVERLALDLQAPSSVQVGDSVELVLHVQNRSATAARVVLGAGPELSFDPIVTQSGKLVWRRWNGLWAGPAGAELVLPPGADTTFSATWDLHDLDEQAVPPGEYRIQARLILEGERPIAPEEIHRLTVVP